jgi:uncharacterized membrane protein YhaH (DUF805 family)
VTSRATSITPLVLSRSFVTYYNVIFFETSIARSKDAEVTRCRVRKLRSLCGVPGETEIVLSFATAVRTCFKKYATFTGVASRPEYWWFVLFEVIGSLIFALTGLVILRLLWTLALLVPGLAVSVRRLHDTNRSAWWLFTGLIWPWFLVLMCLPGKLTDNRYAPDRVDSVATITEASVSSSSSACPSCGKLRLPGQNYCMGCGAKFTDN